MIGFRRWLAGRLAKLAFRVDPDPPLRITTNVPGGFKSMECTLLRELEPVGDFQFDEVRIYGPEQSGDTDGERSSDPHPGMA